MREPSLAVADVLREIEFLESVSSRHSFEQFHTDAIIYRAVAYSIQIISEATRHLPQDWLDDFPEVPWIDVKSMGNRVRHEYFRLSNEILWQVATEETAALKAVLLQMKIRRQMD